MGLIGEEEGSWFWCSIMLVEEFLLEAHRRSNKPGAFVQQISFDFLLQERCVLQLNEWNNG